MIRTRLTLTLACLVMVTVITEPLSAETPKPLTFTYKNGQPVKNSKVGLRGHEAKLKPAAGQVYAYATFDMGPSNPMKFVDGRPQWRNDEAPSKPGEVTDTDGFSLGPQPKPDVTRSADQPQFLQVITLGEKSGEKFTTALRIGLADDGRAITNGEAHVTVDGVPKRRRGGVLRRLNLLAHR